MAGGLVIRPSHRLPGESTIDIKIGIGIIFAYIANK